MGGLSTLYPIPVRIWMPIVPHIWYGVAPKSRYKNATKVMQTSWNKHGLRTAPFKDDIFCMNSRHINRYESSSSSNVCTVYIYIHTHIFHDISLYFPSEDFFLKIRVLWGLSSVAAVPNPKSYSVRFLVHVPPVVVGFAPSIAFIPGSWRSMPTQNATLKDCAWLLLESKAIQVHDRLPGRI